MNHDPEQTLAVPDQPAPGMLAAEGTVAPLHPAWALLTIAERSGLRIRWSSDRYVSRSMPIPPSS